MPFVYVGSGFYDLADPQLYVFRMDRESGALSQVQRLAVAAFPSFIAIAPGSRRLYLNIENSTSAAVAFAIDPATGMLEELNSVMNGANGSAHITTDATGKLVFQANYESGSVVVLGTHPDGSLSGVLAERDMGGPDSYPHSVTVDPSNRFVLVPNRWNPDQPGNYIAQLVLDVATGQLTPNEPARVELPAGTGPRHLALHPNLKFAYVSNERNSTASTYAYDAASGTLTKLQDASTLPAGASGENAPADLRIHPTGRFLYLVNRGQYSLAIFGIDSETGLLTLVGHEILDGEARNLFIDPNGDFLLVGNLKGNSVLVYRIDQQSGVLSALGQPLSVPSPSGIALAYLPGQ